MGWDSGRYPEQLKRGMEHSSQVISAWDGDKLIGLVRGLDDGETVAFLHYLLVDPAYRPRADGAHFGEVQASKSCPQTPKPSRSMSDSVLWLAAATLPWS